MALEMVIYLKINVLAVNWKTSVFTGLRNEILEFWSLAEVISATAGRASSLRPAFKYNTGMVRIPRRQNVSAIF